MFRPFEKFIPFENPQKYLGVPAQGSGFTERNVLHFDVDTYVELIGWQVDTSKNFRAKGMYKIDAMDHNSDLFSAYDNSLTVVRIRTLVDFRVVVGGTGSNSEKNMWELGSYNSFDCLVEYVSEGVSSATIKTQIAEQSGLNVGNAGVITNFSIGTRNLPSGFNGVIGNIEAFDENDVLMGRWAIDEGGTAFDGQVIKNGLIGGLDGILRIGDEATSSTAWAVEMIPDPEDIQMIANGSCEYYDIGNCLAHTRLSMTNYEGMEYLWTVTAPAYINNGIDNQNTVDISSIGNAPETEITATCTRTSPTGIVSTSAITFTHYRTESDTPTRTSLYFNGDTSIDFAGPIDLSQSSTHRYTLRIQPEATGERYDIWGTDDYQNATRVQADGVRVTRGGYESVFMGIFEYGIPYYIEEIWDADTNQMTVNLTDVTTGELETRTRVFEPNFVVANSLSFGDRGLSYDGVLGTISEFQWLDGDDTIIHEWHLDTEVADGGVIEDSAGTKDGILHLGSGFWITEVAKDNK